MLMYKWRMIMVLISKKEDFQSKRMWSFVGKSSRALQPKPVFEGNAGYRLMESDIAREASVNHDYQTMTVAEYRELVSKHTDDMSVLYNRLKNHPNFQYELFMSIYDREGSLERNGFEKATMVGHYYYSNMMYDQLLGEKMDACLDKGYIANSDLMDEVQHVIEHNMISIGDICWDDFEIYDFLASWEKTAFSNIKDNEFSYRKFKYKNLEMSVSDHNENLRILIGEAMDSLEPYQLGQTENYNDVKRAFNRKYYDIRDEEVSPLSVDDDLKMPRRINIALDGLLSTRDDDTPYLRKDSFVLE